MPVLLGRANAPEAITQILKGEVVLVFIVKKLEQRLFRMQGDGGKGLVLLDCIVKSSNSVFYFFSL